MRFFFFILILSKKTSNTNKKILSLYSKLFFITNKTKNMEFSAQQIADFLKGTVVGDSSVKVNNLSKIEAGIPGTLTFLANPKYEQYIYTTKASIVLVNNTFEPQEKINVTLIKVDDAYKSLSLLLNLVEQTKPQPKGISELAYIASSAKIEENVYIAPFSYIGENAEIKSNTKIYPHTFIGNNVKIGEKTTIYAGVKIYENCKIGNNVILHAGSVIGSDGFGFAPESDGSYSKIPQIGNVIIEDNVEIGANATIDCATMGSTIIHKGVKIDNLVHLAHNVEIGENTAMAAQCGIAGSTKIGKNCILAGQVGIAGHINIADRNIFGAQSGIPNSIKTTDQTYMGYPAIPVNKFRRVAISQQKLPEILREVQMLRKELDILKNKLEK